MDLGRTIGAVFDVYGQWFFLNCVYRHELFVLPVVAGLMLIFRSRRWWVPVKCVLIAGTFYYLLLFRMHEYSLIAWPLILMTLGFDWMRRQWYRVIGLRGSQREEAPLSFKDLFEGKRPIWIGGFIVLGVIAWFILNVPLELFVILAVTATVALLAAWRLAVRAADKKRFERYVDGDPRMASYLDWVRSLRAHRSQLGGSIIANNRIPVEE